MTIVYILSALWAAGCLAVAIGVGFYMWRDIGRIAGVVFWITMTPLCALLGAVPFMAIADAKSPTLATLKKGQWACTARHSETVTTMVPAGKVLVPNTTTRVVCDQYTRL